MLRLALHPALITLSLITPALAVSPAEQRGQTFALNNCARCHSIDRVTQSPVPVGNLIRLVRETESRNAAS
jgi:cytochrome c